MGGRYILIGQTPVLCEDLLEWGRWMQEADRVVLRTVVGEWRVSTVFLGLDHWFGVGPPLLFETMIFLTAAERRPDESWDAWFQRSRLLEEAAADQKLAGYQRRYTDWTAAECGHEEAVRLVEQLTGAPRLVSCNDSEQWT